MILCRKQTTRNPTKRNFVYERPVVRVDVGVVVLNVGGVGGRDSGGVSLGVDGGDREWVGVGVVGAGLMLMLVVLVFVVVCRRCVTVVGGVSLDVIFLLVMVVVVLVVVVLGIVGAVRGGVGTGLVLLSVHHPCARVFTYHYGHRDLRTKFDEQ